MLRGKMKKKKRIMTKRHFLQLGFELRKELFLLFQAMQRASIILIARNRDKKNEDEILLL